MPRGLTESRKRLSIIRQAFELVSSSNVECQEKWFVEHHWARIVERELFGIPSPYSIPPITIRKALCGFGGLPSGVFKKTYNPPTNPLTGERNSTELSYFYVGKATTRFQIEAAVPIQLSTKKLPMHRSRLRELGDSLKPLLSTTRKAQQSSKRATPAEDPAAKSKRRRVSWAPDALLREAQEAEETPCRGSDHEAERDGISETTPLCGEVVPFQNVADMDETPCMRIAGSVFGKRKGQEYVRRRQQQDANGWWSNQDVESNRPIGRSLLHTLHITYHLFKH